MSELSAEALGWMKWLGNFGPTVHAHNREMKGYKLDDEDGEGGKTYVTSAEFRKLAAACIEAADYLDKRAADSSSEQTPTRDACSP